jgi:hypothetical protein
MKKPGNWGDGEGRGQAGGGEPEKPEKTLALFQRSPEGALFRSSALTTFSWLGHIFFLLLVDPLKYLDISRDRALTYRCGFIIDHAQRYRRSSRSYYI